MNISVLDIDRSTVLSVLDAFESFIWTDRYNESGDFEIYASATKEYVDLFQIGRYILFSESEHVMVIEKVEIKTGSENGNHIIVSGRSFESVLDRRIVWEQTILSGNLQNAVKKLLDQNAISPAITDRKIDELRYQASSDSSVTGLTLTAQFTGDGLYEAVNAICYAAGLGFKTTFSYDTGLFTFMLYKGTDRSIAQSERSPVIFSPYFDNLIDSNYVANSQGFKTVALILGEGEGADRTRASLDSGYTGINRRELYVDARDISSKTGSGELSPTEYTNLLIQRGREKLAECPMERVFDGSIDYSSAFKPDVDFFLGDIVTVQNEYGLYKNCRVIEMIHSINNNENVVYPSFEEV